MANQKVSRLWFLLPILMGIIGGIIMYFVIKSRNSETAKHGLYLGIALLLVHLVVAYAMRTISAIP